MPRNSGAARHAIPKGLVCRRKDPWIMVRVRVRALAIADRNLITLTNVQTNFNNNILSLSYMLLPTVARC